MNSKILFAVFSAFFIGELINASQIRSDTLIFAKQVNTIQISPELCTPLSDSEGWSVDVWEPGNYCLTGDLKQLWPATSLPHQRLPASPLISIYSSGVLLDLKKHSLSSETPINFGVYKSSSNEESYSPTTIKNGSIQTGEKPTIFMVETWNLDNKRFGRKYSLASSHGDISKYKPTLFILENLIIKGDKHAIIMQRKRNIIRNCIIIGGSSTVNVYGPDLLFEGNTIISDMSNDTNGNESPAALYLEDAGDSIIRNNRIILSGATSINSNAISLANSENVLLEKNTISGTNKIYQMQDDKSSVRSVENHMK